MIPNVFITQVSVHLLNSLVSVDKSSFVFTNTIIPPFMIAVYYSIKGFFKKQNPEIVAKNLKIFTTVYVHG